MVQGPNAHTRFFLPSDDVLNDTNRDVISKEFQKFFKYDFFFFV